ncbi:dihydroorotase [Peptostreptococcus canis]|uniref:Dihydroorotase n=1 Tax=Peptostreptococcus canis TaxID=1159213 RepID=A0ABR6TMZ4_9FIRM|nr:dihydroorotase [Peptostreptococcus canis]MBC2576795.1 dihydroorotase [Peptostreptococcus canis]MBP1998902.1 dihydroorotase [Peptostreptococcus canis]
MNKLLIKNGKIINPATSFEDDGDILIENDKIININKNIDSYDDENTIVINAEGYIVSPGLIDIHVHFRDPGFTHKEDILSGSKAAAAGGFTSVILMANTNPKIDSVENLNYVLDKSKKAEINIFQEAALTYDFKEKIVDMETLFSAGAAGFTNDGVPVMSTNVLREAMLRAKKLGAIIALHEEDNSLIGTHGINDGLISEKLGLKGAPRVSEDLMVSRDCMLALETGATIDIQHISSGNSVDIVRHMKSMGANIIAEVTPHHFTLTEDAVLKYGTLAKMNPPLRTENDRQKILSGLADDTIEIIATDHAPHTFDEKNTEFKKAPSGIIGLETALPLSITELVNKDILNMSHMLSKLTINPSRYYNLDRGDISLGKIADICIFDPNEKYTVKEFKSKSKNSPFTNWELYGKVKYTICGGKIVYSDQ